MTDATASRVVSFLGLGGLANVDHDTASFPLGVLSPYTRDLQRVCSSHDAMRTASGETGAIALGQFVGPPPDEQAPTVAAAYRRSSEALTPTTGPHRRQRRR